MTMLSHKAASWVTAAIADSRAVAEQAIHGNVLRLRWLVLGLVPLSLALTLVFWHFAATDTPRQALWKEAIGWVHLCMALWMGVLGFLAHLHARSGVRPSRLARALNVLAPISGLLFTAVLATVDQLVTPNISPFLLGCVFISLLFQIRPVESLVHYGVSYAFFFVAIGSTQPDALLLLTNRANALMAASLGVMLSIVLWLKNTRYIMLQRELSQRNQELTKQQEELVWLAKRDALTGLFNRGEFLRIAELELMRAQRHGTETSLIMLDLDHFKKVNDLHGHPAGDGVLKHTATCLLGGVRMTDVVARIGGEEFVVLLPQTELDSAVALAEKLARSLQQSPARLANGLEVTLTASFGVGSVPAGYTGTVAALYEAADLALYEAKRLGRNRVEKTEFDSSLTPSEFQRMRRF